MVRNQQTRYTLLPYSKPSYHPPQSNADHLLHRYIAALSSDPSRPPSIKHEDSYRAPTVLHPSLHSSSIKPKASCHARAMFHPSLHASIARGGCAGVREQETAWRGGNGTGGLIWRGRWCGSWGGGGGVDGKAPTLRKKASWGGEISSVIARE